jgi:hypothetical protein
MFMDPSIAIVSQFLEERHIPLLKDRCILATLDL